jgi:hypothetical protein
VTVFLILVAIAVVLGLALLLVRQLLVAKLLRQLNEQVAREGKHKPVEKGEGDVA